MLNENHELGFSVVKAKGKGWEEVKPRPINVAYGFKCRDCGAQIVARRLMVL